MKTVGIITIQKCNNFGADLQAYALGAKLRSMGYDAENIDYLFYKHPQHKGGRLESPVLPISIKNRVKESLYPILSFVKDIKNIKRRLDQYKRFTSWFTTNVKTSREYRSVNSLYDDPPCYDVYMVGSDQVWNPRLCSNIKPYFLDFVPKGAKCISYASSFGVSELTGPVFYKYKQWLKKFTAIGLREKSGERIVKAMAIDAEVANVLDPTLLLSSEEWTKVAIEPDEKPNRKYLLLYDLISSNETVTLAKRWARQNDWQVVRIGDGGYGPGEFLWLFAHAEAVITNSFHGTAFSILNRCPFYTVIPIGMTNANRIESLLASLGLNDRIVKACDCEQIDLNISIDWDAVFKQLDKLREHSKNFLLESIEVDKTKQIKNTPKSAYAVWHKNADIRAASTSGGAFSALALDVLSRRGLVYGAAWDDDFKHVHHIRVENVEELRKLRQSKYVYSDASHAINEAKSALINGHEVLFSGTPCQCASMRNVTKGIDKKLLLVDFVCHGTPLPDVWVAYADELESKYGDRICSYEFRNKDKGWNFQNIVYEFMNGKHKRVLPWLDPYFHGFSINTFLRSCCYACPFAKLERVTDFTIGDCWRVATSNPEYDDNKGSSLILVNTDKAKAMWERILDGGDIAGGVYNIDFAQCRNMALMHPPVKPKCYNNFKSLFDETKSFTTAAKCYIDWKKTVKYMFLYYLKRFGWFYFKHHQ